MKIYFAFFNLCYEDNFIYSKSNYKKKNIDQISRKTITRFNWLEIGEKEKKDNSSSSLTLSITVEEQARSNKPENKTLIIFPSIPRGRGSPPHPSGTPKSSGRKSSLCVVAGPFDGRDDYSRWSVHDPWMGVSGKYDAHGSGWSTGSRGLSSPLSPSVPFSVAEYEYDIAPRHLRNDLSIEHRQPRGTLVLKYYNIIPPHGSP